MQKGGSLNAGPAGPVAAGGNITFTGLNANFNSGPATVQSTKRCAMLNPIGGPSFVPASVPDGTTIVAVQVRTADEPNIQFGGSGTRQVA